MVIDCHTHVFPPKIAENAVKYIGDFYNLEMKGGGADGGTAEHLIEISKGRTDRFVALAVAVSAKQTRRINDFIAETQREYPELIGFGTLHADFSEPAQEVERIISLGLRGIKFHPDQQRFDIDDERLFPVYEAAAGRLPVMYHAGDYRYGFSHPERVRRVAENFPKLDIIAAHFGGWSMPDLAFEILEHTRCFVDTSSSFTCTGKRRAKELINLYGADRVLFGSDYPMWNPVSELDELLSLGLSAGDTEKITCRNITRLLGL